MVPNRRARRSDPDRVPQNQIRQKLDDNFLQELTEKPPEAFAFSGGFVYNKKVVCWDIHAQITGFEWMFDLHAAAGMNRKVAAIGREFPEDQSAKSDDGAHARR